MPDPDSAPITPNGTKRQTLESPSNGSLRAVWAARSPNGEFKRLKLDDIKKMEAAFGSKDQVALNDSCSADLGNMVLKTDESARARPLERRLLRSHSGHKGSNTSRRDFDGRCVFLNKLADSSGSPDTLSFSEVVGPPEEIESMLMSSFSTDFDWLQSELGSTIPITLVDDKDIVGEGPENVTVVYPTFPRSQHFSFKNGTMHAKLMLIKFKTTNKLRIVITSANLIPFDWDRITQTIWVCDVDRDSPGEQSTTFGDDLTDFVKKLIPHDSPWTDELSLWTDAMNKSVPSDITLVASVPGTFYGQDALKYGQLRLREIIKKHSAQGGLVQYQMSSIGKFDGPFETDFIDSINATQFKIVFPTFNDAVCLDGKEHIFLNQRNAMTIRPFLTPLTRTPDRIHVLNHSKCIHADAWMYYGSHNLSMPAWGRFEYDKTTFRVASFELGIVVKKSPHMRLNIPWDLQTDPQPMTGDPWMHDVYIQMLQKAEEKTQPDDEEIIRTTSPKPSGCLFFIRENDIELLCLDVDGTVVANNTSSRILPPVVSFLTQLDTSKTKIALVTNQGAVGLRHWMEIGKFGEPEKFPTREEVESRLDQIKTQIESLTDSSVKLFAAYRYQTKGANPRWGPVPYTGKDDPRWSQEWRKPGPGMIREAMKWAKISPLVGLKKVLMVGDMDADEGAAKAAGVRFAKAPNFFQQ